jgi:murein DD-endopeptidase MepM/ murein hydrolase activator NlpD
MNITDTSRYGRQKQLMGTEAALSMLIPVASTGLMISISDVLKNGKAVRQQKFFNSAVKKIKYAVMVANRDNSIPENAKLEDEEKAVVMGMLEAAEFGVGSMVTTFCEALFSFVPFAIECVAAPMFSAFSWTVVGVLPLLLSPEGLITLGAVGVSGLLGYLYNRWKTKDTSEIKVTERPSSSAPRPSLASGAPAAGESKISATDSRGLRSNNPGNIEYAGQPYALPKVGRFAQFATQGQGLYNLGRQLELYYSRGRNTVRSIVCQYAPPNENHTGAYIADVSQRMGVTADQVLNLGDKITLTKLMSSIIQQENGKNPYSATQLDMAADQALAFAANGYKDLLTARLDPSMSLILPTSGIVSSPFGHRHFIMKGASVEHQGVDIAGPIGTPIYAVDDGQVEVAKQSNSYGNFVQLKHSSMWTRYGHLSKIGVQQGAQVTRGQKIGEMGSTGISTGTHLHFEVQPFTAKAPVDPAIYLPELRKGQQIEVSNKAGLVPMITTDKTFINKDGQIIALD